MNNDLLFSSKKDDWQTPPYLFEWLDRQYHFTLDAAANHSNHLCDKYYTKEDNALNKDWKGEVWLNPPYGRNIGKWVEKAYNETRKYIGTKVVMLIPARTDTKYFHEYCVLAHTIIFLEGRIKFYSDRVECKTAAPFPSIVVVFDTNNVFCEPVVKYKSLKEIKNETCGEESVIYRKH